MTPTLPWAPFASSWHRSSWIALGVGLGLSVLSREWELAFVVWVGLMGSALTLDVLVLLIGIAFHRSPPLRHWYTWDNDDCT